MQMPELSDEEAALLYYSLQGTITKLTQAVGTEDERDGAPLINGVFEYVELRDKLFPDYEEPTYRAAGNG